MAALNAKLSSSETDRSAKTNLGVLTQDAIPAQLTPSFFDSIFNDGMNPFDECFTSVTASSSQYPSNQRMALKGRNGHRFHGEKQADVRVHSHVDADLQLLRMKQTSPLSPPISPEISKQPEFSALVTSRSPSPYSFSNPFLPSPTSSTSPITSPEAAAAQPTDSKRDKQLSQVMGGLTLPGNNDMSNRPTQFYNDCVQLQEPHLLSRRATVHTSNPIDEISQNGTLTQSSSSPSDIVNLQPHPSTGHRSASTVAVPSIMSSNSRNTTNSTTRKVSSGETTKKRKSRSGQGNKSPLIKSEEDPAEIAGFMAINDESPRKRKSFNGESTTMRSLSEEMEDMEDDDMEGEGGLDSEAKRARFLERNRIAASKCRRKKKMMNARLEEKSRVLQTENRYLNIEREQLKADVCKLKQIVLMHHSCGCEAIQKYLKQEAGKFFELSNEAEQSRSYETEFPKLKSDKTESSDVEMNLTAWNNQLDERFADYENYGDSSNNIQSHSQSTLMEMKDEDFALMFDHMAQ